MNSQKYKDLKGFVLVAHGLNLKPEKMGSLIEVLNNRGLQVSLVSLAGHNAKEENNMQIFQKVTYHQWLQQIYQAYKEIQHQAEQSNKPIFFLGYSLGALLGMDLILEKKEVHFTAGFLISPALRVHWRCFLMCPLALFPRWIIPSDSPVDYRVNQGTPVAAYLALYKGMTVLNKKMHQRLNIPLQIIMDPEDELVSYKRLKKWMTNNKLTRWNIHSINKIPQHSKDYHHLIVDVNTVGDAAWIEIIQMMTQQFEDINNVR